MKLIWVYKDLQVAFYNYCWMIGSEHTMVHMNQGYPPGPGGYPPAPAPAHVNSPNVFMMGGGGGGGGTHCLSCGRPTESISRKTLGCTAAAWIVVLLFTVPIIACVPCCC